MLSLRGSTPHALSFFVIFSCFELMTPCFSPAAWAQAQSYSQDGLSSPLPQSLSGTGAATSLDELLAEAERNNPQIRAAEQGWDAAKQVAPQVSALPNPQAVVQHFTVGSPRPFAGYTNSDFAYLGLGVSQDIPYPGKLKLKGEIAKQDENLAQQQYEAVQRSVRAEVEAAYWQLASLDQTLALLHTDQQLLQQVEQAAEARYRSGMGTQEDILRAQLERTKLLSEITSRQLSVAKWQAELKQLVNRQQTSPDVVPSQPGDAPLSYTFDELLAAAQSQNPLISGSRDEVERARLQIDLAHTDFRPDFSLQYMWQRTDPERYRAYYMLTLGVSVPIHRSKLHAELAQAQSQLNRSEDELQSQSQEVASELRIEYETAQKTSDLLQIDREGLLPQARTAFQSAIAAYQNNRQDFSPVLDVFLNVLRVDEDFSEHLSQRNVALARLEELTGLPIRAEAER